MGFIGEMKCSVAFHLRFRKKLKIITKFQINFTRAFAKSVIRDHLYPAERSLLVGVGPKK